MWNFGRVSGTPSRKEVINRDTVPPLLSADGDGIRLLYLLPGQPGSVIKADLKAVKISASPPYECISYMWGAPGTAEHIDVNDISTPLRRNLWTFLQKLRSPVSTRIVWVDALCISQNDPVEKMQQVQMIGRIFQGATRVLAWVSEDENNDSFKIFDHARRYSYGWAETQHLERQGLKLDVMDLKDQLLRFSQREYWSRTWIVQEIVLARLGTLHCGNDHCDLDTFLILVYSLARTEDGNRRLSPHLRRLAMERSRGLSKSIDPDRFHHDATPERRLDFLLRNFADTKCFLARDRVFALLSIEEKTPEDKEIVPDYTIDDLALCIEIWKSRRVSYEGRYGTGSTQLLGLIVDALGVSRGRVDSALAAAVRNRESSTQREQLDNHSAPTTTRTTSSITATVPQSEFNARPIFIIVGIAILYYSAKNLPVAWLPQKVEPSPTMDIDHQLQAEESNPLSPAVAEPSEPRQDRMSLSTWRTWIFWTMVLVGGFCELVLPGVIFRKHSTRQSEPEKRRSDLIDSLCTYTRIATFSATVVAWQAHGLAGLNYLLVTAIYSWVEAENVPYRVRASLEEAGIETYELAITIAHGVVVAYICSLNYVFHLAADPLMASLNVWADTDEEIAWGGLFGLIGVLVAGYSWSQVCAAGYYLVCDVWQGVMQSVSYVA